jgi:N-acetyl-gamma-glutamyl-phosphate reductase
MVRGIFAAVQFALPPGLDPDGLAARAREAFRDAPLVRLVADSPRIGAVTGSAFADLSVAARDGSGVVLAAIDNLGKGMAAQAVQNMNLSLGFPETLGLRIPGRYPG